ncbi:hypothetical protein VTK26DRAFT_376 [Humicola hyalothermophila]
MPQRPAGLVPVLNHTQAMRPDVKVARKNLIMRLAEAGANVHQPIPENPQLPGIISVARVDTAVGLADGGGGGRGALRPLISAAADLSQVDEEGNTPLASLVKRMLIGDPSRGMTRGSSAGRGISAGPSTSHRWNQDKFSAVDYLEMLPGLRIFCGNYLKVSPSRHATRDDGNRKGIEWLR